LLRHSRRRCPGGLWAYQAVWHRVRRDHANVGAASVSRPGLRQVDARPPGQLREAPRRRDTPLETGIQQHAAIRLYEREGFERIPPFGNYRVDPISLCYERNLT